MNRIILVGNGFDLAHNLPTKYEDFINWYSHERFISLENNNTQMSADQLCTLHLCICAVYDDLYWNSSRNLTQYYEKFRNCKTWHDFYIENSTGKYKGHIDLLHNDFKILSNNNSVIYSVKCSHLFENITKSIETTGWVDIENEYYNFLRSFLSEKKYNNPKQLNDELDFIRTKLIEYLTLVQDKYINEGIINEEIGKKITEPFNKKDLSNETFEYFKKVRKIAPFKSNKETEDYIFSKTGQASPENILILDFNYTKTADLYLTKRPYIKIKHIHGDLENSDSVIFGYGDELDRDYKELSRLNNNELLRNIKSIKYLESSNYRSILSFIGWEKFQIYIMGHSCGNSDRTLLNTLFEHENCASIKPFYHKSKNGKDNYLDIVQNISRNFTDMKLMRDRVVNKEFCEPLPQNNSTKKQEI